MNNGLNVLFDKYVIDILKIINDNPEVQKTKVSEMLNSTSPKIRDLIDKMISEKYIIEKKGMYNNTKLLILSDEGYRIYQLIQMMQKGEGKPQSNLSSPSEEGDTVKE